MLFVKSDAYRARMEAFVTGLNGASTFETVTCMATIPIALLLLRGLLSVASASGGAVPPPRTWGVATRFAVEACVLVAAPLATMTVLAEWNGAVNAALLGAALVAHGAAAWLYYAGGQQPRRGEAAPLAVRQVAVDAATPGRAGFVSSFRSGMMLSTCIAILAVDFTVFPRRFAKTETVGVSMMDLGVGSFVLASALVSRQTRAPFARASGERAAGGSGGFADTLRGLAPLVALGVGKLLVHTAVNYQVHVSEYGVHWNFFFTLIAVALFAVALEGGVGASSAAVAALRRPPPGGGGGPRGGSSSGAAGGGVGSALLYLASGLALSAAHHAVLAAPPPTWLVPTAEMRSVWVVGGDGGGGRPGVTLGEYILFAGRPASSLFSQNREGIAGVGGFFALYVCGVGVGRLVLDPARWRSRRQDSGADAGGGLRAGWRRALPLGSAAACCALWVLLVVSTANVVLGVWRPRLMRAVGRRPPAAEALDRNPV